MYIKHSYVIIRVIDAIFSFNLFLNVHDVKTQNETANINAVYFRLMNYVVHTRSERIFR